MLSKALAAWRCHVTHSYIKRAKCDRAEVHYLSVLREKCYYGWREYVAHRHWKSEALEKSAAQFRYRYLSQLTMTRYNAEAVCELWPCSRERMEVKCFRVWRDMYYKSMDVRTMERMVGRLLTAAGGVSALADFT